jgi:hypothetical protein
MTDFVLFCLIGFVTLFLTVFGGIVATKRLSHRMIFCALGVLGLLLTIITGYRAYLAQAALSEASSRLDKSIESLKHTSAAIESMSTESLRISDSNSKLQAKLFEQSKTIEDLSKKTLDTAIGGKAFCYLVAGIPSAGHGWVPLIMHVGDYPLYGVTARIVNMAKLRAEPVPRNVPLSELRKTETTLRFGDVHPIGGTVYFNALVPMDEGPIHVFKMFFAARNGVWYQDLKLTNINGNWREALRVYRTSGKRDDVLFETADEDFPRNQKGKVEW